MEEIKEKLQKIVEEVVEKLKSNPSLLKQFKEEPVKALEKLIGKDLPDEQIEKVITLIKAKLAKDKIEDSAEELKDKAEDAVDNVKDVLKGLGSLFGKK